MRSTEAPERRLAASKPKLNSLEALRFFAALIVVITHSTYLTSERLGIRGDYWHRGAAGVDIFFVLSGFVMIYSSTRLIQDPRGWRIFAEKRIFRIVPMYWLATTIKLVILIIAPVVVLHAKLRLVSVLCSYLFLPTKNFEGHVEPLLGVGWTLTFEMFFYFLFTLALALRTNVYRFIGAILVICSVISIFCHPNSPAIMAYFNPINLEFFFGMLIAKYIMSGKRLHPMLACGLLVLGLAGLFSGWQDLGLGHVFTTGLPAAVCVWSVASLESYIGNRIPSVILFLAEASYVLYLFHPLLVPVVPMMFARLHIHFISLSVIAGVIVAIVVTSAIHALVERPITERLRLFAFDKRRNNRKAVRHQPS